MLYQSGNIEQITEISDHLVSKGIESLYFPDHLIGGGNAETTNTNPWLAMTPTMMTIALRHKEIIVGPLVASPLLRPSAQLAVELSTCAHILGSQRLTTTIGAGGAKSDQEILGTDLNSQDLSHNLEKYLSEIKSYTSNDSNVLRLPCRELNLRIASDSNLTIDLVAQTNCDWVTTGGWKKSFEDRVRKINVLNAYLKSVGWKKNVSICIDNNDFIDINSKGSLVKEYVDHFDFEVNELIFTATSSSLNIN